MSNMISFTGRVVADSELRYIPSGEAVLSVRVANDVGFGDKKATNWFTCNVWGKRAESLKQYLVKGTPVTMFGTLLMREWTDKEGGKRLSPEVRVSEVVLHGSKDKDSDGESHNKSNSTPPAAPAAGGNNNNGSNSNQDDLEDDKIPF